MSGRACRVSYRDLEGIRHTVDVVAESVYEAGALALSALSKDEWTENIGPATRLEIQIVEPNVTHTLYVGQLQTWLIKPASTPAETVRKKKLKDLLAS